MVKKQLKPSKSSLAKKKPAGKEKPKPKSKDKKGSSSKDIGKKHACYNCGTKFYDFAKPEPICPKCGANQLIKPVIKQKSRIAPKISEFDVVDEELEIAPGEEEDMILDPEVEEETEPVEEEETP
ncbi:MAG: FYDLN acid domain-containing protein [Leptospira sp.]|nr:FYDLN acid domain-containing protein [Leptospira sp.]